MTVAVNTRRATVDDLPALTDCLARAFFDDPVAIWSCRPDSLRAGMLERFYAIRLRQLIVHQEIWMTDGHGSAALWTPPGHWHTTPREDLQLTRCLLHPRIAWRLPLVMSGLLRIEREHPKQPEHWYLAVLGTDPDHQGMGLGSAALAPVLELCDRDGVGAYLESSKERNIDFYARHGFRVTKELRLPSGPPIWGMWRDPHSAA